MVETQPDITTRAIEAAEAAARRASVTIRQIHDLRGEAAISELFDRVWGTDGQPVMPANLLRAVSHAGNYLSAAYANDSPDEERLVGAAFGFLGWKDGETFLHSHMTGVDPSCQRTGVGFALKLHQRAWALHRGLNRIEWTFDPLVRRNSYFNLVKLGAEIVHYHVNFYGDMIDSINNGDESDRVVVSWDITSDHVTSACEGKLPEPDVDSFRRAGATVALDFDRDGHPRTRDALAPLLLCRIPEDVVQVRKEDPRLALDWRRALRSTLGHALQNGHRAKTITRSGWYLLEQKEAA